MNPRVSLLVLCLICTSINLSGQIEKLNSQLNEYEKAKYDSTRCRLMLQIGGQYRDTSYDTAMIWYNRADTIALLHFSENEVYAVYSAEILLEKGNLESFHNGDYTKATEFTNKSLEQYKTLSTASTSPHIVKRAKKGIACCYMNYGSFYFYQSMYDDAEFNYQKALNIFQEIEYSDGLAKCFYRSGLVWLYQGNYEKALAHFLKSEKIFNDLAKKEEMGACYYHIACLHKFRNDIDGAMKYYRIALDIYEELEVKEGISMCYDQLGWMYSVQGDFEKAMEYYLKTLEIAKKMGFKRQLPVTYCNIATAHAEMGNYEEAIKSYQKSIEIDKEFGELNGLAITYNNIAGLYVTQVDSTKDITEAKRIAYLEKALDYAVLADQISQKTGALQSQNAISQVLIKIYSKLGRYKDAVEYANIFIATKDSMFNIEKTRSFAEAEKKYEAEKKQLQIDQMNKESVLQRRHNVILLIGLIVILLFLVFMTRLFLQKKKASEEIRFQKNEIERISGKLIKTSEMKLRFFANLSHEFRTPLTLILNPAKILLDKTPDDKEYNKYVGFIYKNALKLYDLTNQILELQKLDSGKLHLNVENSEVIKYCRSIVSSFESICEKKNNKLHFIANHSSVITSFDKDKLAKILVNLLSNSFKFCFQRTIIEIEVNVNENGLRIKVSDIGIGIPMVELDNVFKRYYQVETTNMQSEGTGLGLAYVKELTEFMQGTIEIESKENEGTKIEVCIPVEEFDIIDSAPLNIEITPCKQNTESKAIFDCKNEQLEEGSETILIVEDNDELRDLIGGLFLSKFHIVYAKDGAEGVLYAEKYMPDIIISDIMMPIIDGIELCGKLKRGVLTSHIPIIFLTAKDNFESHIEGYQSGVDDYIVKPFDSQLLIFKVENILKTLKASRRNFNFELDTIGSLPKNSSADKEFLNKCISLIKENMMDSELSVEVISKELAFSRRNLYRKIKALTDHTPAELIRNIRMKHAAYLLKNSDLRIYEIAESVGYNDNNKFSQAFKKYHGTLPSGYLSSN